MNPAEAFVGAFIAEALEHENVTVYAYSDEPGEMTLSVRLGLGANGFRHVFTFKTAESGLLLGGGEIAADIVRKLKEKVSE